MAVVLDRVRRSEAVNASGAAADGRQMPAWVRRHAFTLVAVAIVLLAAVLRFWRLDMAEFKGDELQVAQLAFDLALHGQWPERGILSSLGTYNSPFFIYLEALPALLWASPLALTALVAALNVVAIAMAIVFARRYFGPTTALVAGVLFATAPWAVVYSRKIWEQDALPPIVLLFFFALFAVVVDRKPRALLLCGIAAGMAIQLHPSAIALPVIALIALLLWPRRFPRRIVLTSIALAVLVTLPYLYAEGQHHFADWHSALAGGGQTHLGPALGLLVSLINWGQSVSGWQALGMFAADGTGYHDPVYVTIADITMWCLLSGAAVQLVVRWRRTVSHRDERADQILVLLTLWLLVPPLLLGLSGLLTFPHYFIAAYPAPFLAIGVLVEAVSTSNRWRRTAVFSVVAALALANVATVAQVLLATDRSPFPNDYGLPLALDTAAAGAIAQDAAGRPYAITVDPAFRDGQQVIDQLVAWKAGPTHRPAGNDAPARYWLLPAGVAPPAGARLLLPLGPASGPAVAGVWTSSGPPDGAVQP